MAAIVGLSSCNPIMLGLYGMKKPKTLSESSIQHYCEKYNISSNENFELDTAYISFVSSLDTNKYRVQKKNHSQPLQALYYDKTGKLISFQNNCYAGGFPNLKWNRNGIMATFPPGQQAPIDSIFSLDLQLKYLKILDQTKDYSFNNSDYIVIVYWSRFMGRQSKRFIHFVQENSKLGKGENVKILYVNTDNVFAITVEF